MQAVQAMAFGDPEVLVLSEVPDPVPAVGDVVVRVAAADVLGLDVGLRAGEGREYFSVEPPFIPGDGVAGTVTAISEGVDPAWRGATVVGTTGVFGAYAEQAVVNESDLVAVPEGLDLVRAAALIHDGRTALALMDGVNVGEGDWVLVQPAGSGLGLLLVQLARARGGRVVAAARGEAKLRLARDCGAELAVDYTQPSWIEDVLRVTVGRGVDATLDGVGGEVGRAAFDATRRGGRYSGHGDSSGSGAGVDLELAQQRGIEFLDPSLVHIGGTPRARELLERALDMAARGDIFPVVGQTFELERAADAHAAIARRSAQGRTVLTVEAHAISTRPGRAPSRLRRAPLTP